MSISVNELPGHEVLNLLAKGEVLFCPVCNARLITIPQKLEANKRPLGVVCPTDQKHYLVYGESPESTQEIRKQMRAMINNK
jgi:hypothetical protein